MALRAEHWSDKGLHKLKDAIEKKSTMDTYWVPGVKPKSGRIAVKVINHLGDEVMKVFKVG